MFLLEAIWTLRLVGSDHNGPQIKRLEVFKNLPEKAVWRNDFGRLGGLWTQAVRQPCLEAESHVYRSKIELKGANF